MAEDAPEALIFQDEVEIHRLPTLTRMWGPVGDQPEVPSPGQNEKKVVFGSVDYATGRIVQTVADTKSGWNFLIFLMVLVKAYAGRKIRWSATTAASTRPRPCGTGWRPMRIS